MNFTTFRHLDNTIYFPKQDFEENYIWSISWSINCQLIEVNKMYVELTALSLETYMYKNKILHIL